MLLLYLYYYIYIQHGLLLIRRCLFLDFDLEKLTVENCKSYFEGKDVLFVALSRTWNDSKRLPGRAIVTAHT